MQPHYENIDIAAAARALEFQSTTTYEFMVRRSDGSSLDLAVSVVHKRRIERTRNSQWMGDRYVGLSVD